MNPRGFLNSDLPDPEPKFTALGQAGSGAYEGLEPFPNPGCSVVQYTSDELVAHCPVTGQPDFYTCVIQLKDTENCIESKSLKLWLRQFADSQGPGIFCEGLAVFIRDEVASAVGTDPDNVTVQLTQKSRGGISIMSVA